MSGHLEGVCGVSWRGGSSVGSDKALICLDEIRWPKIIKLCTGANVSADLLGFVGIAAVAIFTLLIARAHPSAAKLLTVAFLIRSAALLGGHYFIALPGSGDDSLVFQATAIEWSQGGFFLALSHFTGPDSYFISWLLALIYALTEPSALLGKSVSLLFGLGTVWMGYLLAKRLWGPRAAVKAGWFVALFPTLILYSALIFREAYIAFFLVVALYGVVGWARSGGGLSFGIAMLGFIGATFFHGGMIVGAVVLLAIIALQAARRLLKALTYGRVRIVLLGFAFLALTGLGLFVSDAVDVPKIGTFSEAIDLERLVEKAQKSTRGSAGYPEWLVPQSPIDLAYVIPIRTVYLLFSPFPWEVQSATHLIGVFDGVLYLALAFFLWRHWRAIWADPASRAIVLILAAYFVVFGIATGNFGTSMRHRAKFVVPLIALVAPRLKLLRLPTLGQLGLRRQKTHTRPQASH